jgi:hypothetical protein
MKRIPPFALPAVAILSTLACSLRHAPEAVAYAPRAEIEITSSPSSTVLIYGGSPSRFALSGEVLSVRSDTIRTTTPARLEAYLNAGEIHIVADGKVPVEVAAKISNAPATHATAAGGHIVLESGGTGIRSLR